MLVTFRLKSERSGSTSAESSVSGGWTILGGAGVVRAQRGRVEDMQPDPMLTPLKCTRTTRTLELRDIVVDGLSLAKSHATESGRQGEGSRPITKVVVSQTMLQMRTPKGKRFTSRGRHPLLWGEGVRGTRTGEGSFFIASGCRPAA